MDLIQSGFGNTDLLEELYNSYKKDPSLLDPSWQKAFESLDNYKITPTKKPSVAPSPAKTVEEQAVKPTPTPISEDRRVFDLIEAYRIHGHLGSNLNPLKDAPAEPEILNLKNFGFTDTDLQKKFPTLGLLSEQQASLEKIVTELKRIYCGTVGVEYRGHGTPEMEKWLQEQIERNGFTFGLTIDQKKMILQYLNKSELFENFLHTKYTGQKRFSLEGGETLIPLLAAIVDRGAELGISEFLIGMAHRGRLNVLSNILHKSYSLIFSEFDENYIPESFEMSGDVKYHKGFLSDTFSSHGHKVQISITPNPSHLEAVDAVVEGQAYARQKILNRDTGKTQVLPLLIHGDAALSGQGIVYETLQMQSLKGYGTGGSVHVVINNQIGFTTVPSDSRSTRYCTDIAKAFNAPVFHVNAEDPEAAVFAAYLAIELRQRFGCDVFIDMICYRKFGHNETDEPAYTQPHEYQIIGKKKSIRETYRDHLITEGVLEKAIAEELEGEFKKSLNEELKAMTPAKQEAPVNVKTQPEKQDAPMVHIQTGVPLQILQEIATAASRIPDGFTLHPKLVKLVKEREAMLSTDTSKPIDWGTGEMLAFGSLLWEGASIRLSGQDSCRGTFSHRHAMWMDQQDDKPYYPLQHLKEGQGQFDVINSPLSEYAVLGFEYGYNLANPSSLVMWEAQFGDFCNGAQIIIDQFISTGEQKWGQQSSLVLLLPHGYEGQGPEHSSARMERFMTLAGQNNMRIVNPSTPAQLFHLIRSQQKTNEKKPLIVFTPKALLRHPECISAQQDFVMGSFNEILDDPNPPADVRCLALCSGHIYYDLLEQRKKEHNSDIALVRVEQLYPFDGARMKELLSKYSEVKEVVWVQEEPSNMGAGKFICSDLSNILPQEVSLRFIARPRSASPAVGSYAAHKKQLKNLFEDLFGQKKPSIFDIASEKKPRKV
jgi:2-oxoglutarate dehydrogenase E1 component